MSGFSAGWLELRASADTAARSTDLARRFAAALGPHPAIVDLGAGTGSLLRWLGPYLPKRTRWVLIEGDAKLLALAPSTARKRRASLMGKLPRADAYVSSALIDLAGPAWLAKLVRAAHGAPLLMYLGVDGTHRFDPPHADDAAFLAAFQHHQRRVKGLGPALAGEAPFVLARLARKAGYTVTLAQSDWHLTSRDILTATVEGMADAVREQAPALDLSAWLGARRRQIAAGGLTLTVGHRDLLAVRRTRRPTGRRV
jgi:hypothetical protein